MGKWERKELYEYREDDYDFINKFMNEGLSPDKEDYLLKNCLYDEYGHVVKHFQGLETLYLESLYKPNRKTSIFCDMGEYDIDKKNYGSPQFEKATIQDTTELIRMALGDNASAIAKWLYQDKVSMYLHKNELEDKDSKVQFANADGVIIEGSYNHLSVVYDTDVLCGMVLSNKNGNSKAYSSSVIHIELERNDKETANETGFKFTVKTAYPTTELYDRKDYISKDNQYGSYPIDYKIDVHDLEAKFPNIIDKFLYMNYCENQDIVKQMEAAINTLPSDYEYYEDLLSVQTNVYTQKEEGEKADISHDWANIMGFYKLKDTYKDNDNIKLFYEFDKKYLNAQIQTEIEPISVRITNGHTSIKGMESQEFYTIEDILLKDVNAASMITNCENTLNSFNNYIDKTMDNIAYINDNLRNSDDNR